MTFGARQRLGWLVLLTAALLGGAWLATLNFSEKLSTNVLDLVPSGDQAPELRLVRSLAGDAEARTMLIVLERAGGGPVSVDVTQRFAERLRSFPVFDQAVSMDDAGQRDALGAEVFTQRFALLFPRWLARQEEAYRATGGEPDAFAAWLAQKTAGELEAFLATPEALAFGEVIPADPLLLLPLAVKQFQGGLALVQPPGGAVEAGRIWARLAASPLSEEGQQPAFVALAQVLDEIKTDVPDLTVAYTGVNRFAASSRARIEREVKGLNLISVIAVLAVALTFVRRVHRGLHLLPVVLLSVLGAWVGTTLIFERLHILVLVVGSMLTGVAIDYGFYLFMQPPSRPDEEYPEKVRRLAKPLLASCLTTVAGFALLLFSELPFIRQLGVYVGIGLVCALGAALVYFATVRVPFLETRDVLGGRALPELVRRWLRRGLLALWFATLPGLFFMTWKDDIRDLDIPSPELHENDARLRAQFGGEAAQSVYLSFGDTLAEAREAVARFEAWLAGTGTERTVVSLGTLVPTEEERQRAADFVRREPGFPASLRAAWETAGFEAAEFAPFFAAYPKNEAQFSRERIDQALAAVEARLAGPLGLLLHRGQPFSWFVTLVSPVLTVEPPAELQTVGTGQLQSLNTVFSRYRESALKLSLVGLAIVGLGVFLTYGVRDGIRIFAIPCGACLGVFGAFGWLGLPLNLFHLLGAFLGVCLTHNYSIFSATSAYRGEATPVSVRVSALTTAASFLVLSTSGIPVVSALGTTVAAMVIVALAAIEFEHLATLGAKS